MSEVVQEVENNTDADGRRNPEPKKGTPQVFTLKKKRLEGFLLKTPHTQLPWGKIVPIPRFGERRSDLGKSNAGWGGNTRT